MSEHPPHWLALLRRHWFLVGLLSVITLAWLAPDIGRTDGWLGMDQWRNSLVATIFISMGMAMPTVELGRSLRNWRLHSLVQGVSLGAYPLLMWGICTLLKPIGLPHELTLGLLALASLPTTITSCVVFTQSSGGNSSAALCNAVLGNLLGVVLTPLWWWWFLGAHAPVDLQAILSKLLMLVVLPLCIGQALRSLIAHWLDSRRKIVSYLNQTCVLLIVLQVLSEQVAQNTGKWATGLSFQIPIIVLINVTMFALLSCAIWKITRIKSLGLRYGERIAALHCAPQKTLALGVPLLAILFDGQTPVLMLIPLLLYHPMQLTAAALLADRLSRRKLDTKA